MDERVLTIGNFDGVHIGHVELINKLKYIEKVRNLRSLVYVIERPYFGERIITKRQKESILKNMGIDDIYFENFTNKFKAIEAKDFINDILKDRFNAKVVVVGCDFRFGKNREGDIDYLKKFLDVEVVQKVDGVSSTKIRRLIRLGKMIEANKLLGRSFSLQGKVIAGRSLGRMIGFRTANILVDEKTILPSNGVYKTKTLYNNKIYDSITNIGYNPTVSGLQYKSVETNIFDFSEDIYGEEIEVYFLGKIREEKKFCSVDELVNQIKDDIKKVRKV